MTTRIAIAGLGLMGRRYADIVAGWANSGLVDVALAGAVDRAAEARDWWDCGPGRAAATPAVEGVDRLDWSGVDVLVVALPDDAHTEVAREGFRRGCAVLVEKPLATDPAEARSIRDAAVHAGKPLGLGNLLRFDPRYAEAATEVRRGRIGEVVQLSARRFSAIGAAARYGSSTALPWHVSWHDVDQVVAITGRRVVEVHARGRSRALADLGHWDSLAALLVLDDQTPAVIESGWTLPGHLAASIDSRLEIVGTDGAITVHGRDEGLRIVDADATRHPDVLRHHDHGVAPGGALARLLFDFVARVRAAGDGDAAAAETLDVQAADAVHVTAVVAALDESLRTGGPITTDQGGNQ